ncbi:MAG TPA: hypothetical protein VKZ63_03685 [Kofleriaceae bacterium]|nr:hypothetical protein [Kofleriaceae bacterium]
MPPEIAEDPGFAAELDEIGWHPWEPAAGLHAVPGDGERPPASILDGPDIEPQGQRDRWGGLAGSGLSTTATGFFHIERPPGAARVWLVDPDGNPFWSVGLNTVLRSANAPDLEAYLRRLPDFDEVARIEWDRLSDGAGGGYGYFFNSAPGFSETNDLDRGAPSPITRVAPYGVRLSVSVPEDSPLAMRSAGGAVLGAGDSSATLGDPFDPAYRELLAARWQAQVRPGDPHLLVYWLDNEIGLFDHPLHVPPGTRDLRGWIWRDCPAGSSLDQPRCASHAFARFLRDRYGGDAAALASAWGRPLGAFEDVLALRPAPGSGDPARRCDGACEADMQRFQRVLWRRYVTVWTGLLRELDPDHLVGSPRMAVASSDSYCFWGVPGCIARWTDGRRVKASSEVTYSPFRLFRRNGPYGFDVVALNVYSRADRRGYDQPWLRDGIHKIVRESALPVWVSEFGVRARIDGWTNSGGAPAFVPRGAPAEQQTARGAYYQYDMAQFGMFRAVVGAAYHRWADRYLPDQQMNMGVIHRDGSRWDRFDGAIRQWNAGVYTRLRQMTGW